MAQLEEECVSLDKQLLERASQQSSRGEGLGDNDSPRNTEVCVHCIITRVTNKCASFRVHKYTLLFVKFTDTLSNLFILTLY